MLFSQQALITVLLQFNGAAPKRGARLSALFLLLSVNDAQTITPLSKFTVRANMTLGGAFVSSHCLCVTIINLRIDK